MPTPTELNTPSAASVDQHRPHYGQSECHDVQQYMQKGKDQLREIVQDNAGRGVLVALAAGFGLGIVLGQTLAGSSRSNRWTDRVAAEGLGRRLMSQFEGLAPDALKDYLNR